jgi:hypothetical protein
MRVLFAILIVGTLVLANEAELQQEEVEVKAEKPLLGRKKPGDKCLGSAGYSWCEATQDCRRLWETPCPMGVTAPGKCNTGLSWCETRQRCVATELLTDEKECPSISTILAGARGQAGIPANGACPTEQGLVYCASLGKCIDPSTERCDAPLRRHPAGRKEVQTPKAEECTEAGTTWCEGEGKCLRPRECAKNIEHDVEQGSPISFHRQA